PKPAAPKPAAAKPAAPKSSRASKTVAELRAEAKDAGIKGYSTMKKAELLTALG
ncbi:MAG: Rho termination factor N-terminal domain-containing protein, partial [Gordonia sp. (in: high G+C Gram-positive bacteria)]